MVDQDSHSTDVSVSGEEGHSTILLALVLIEDNDGYAAKIHKND